MTNEQLWDRCWAAARYRLRLTDAEFFALTPRQFHLLLGEARDAAQQNEFLVGLLAAVVGNHSFSPPKQAYAPADFMPSQWGKPKPRRCRRQTRKQVADHVRGMFEGMMRSGSPDNGH